MQENNVSNPLTQSVSNSVPTVTTVPTNDQQPKTNGFLVILLSILLITSLAIAGFFAFQTQKLVKELTFLRTEPTPMATTEPTTEPVATSSSEVDPTAGWKTYTNTEIGFNLRYPTGWSMISANLPRVASFDTKSNNSGEFFIAYHKNIDDLSKWLTDNQAGKIIDNKNINGNQFLIVKGGVLNVSREYFTKVGTNNYVRLVVEPFPNSAVADSTIDQILSTFKFTD